MPLHATMPVPPDARTDAESGRPNGSTIRPAKEACDRLQQAYGHFNETLFGSTLPNARVTLRRGHRSAGFFVPARFANGGTEDEIVLNLAACTGRPLPDMLAGLVHEMVHLWQHHFGQPGRGRYHNREWADKMKALGLQPVDAGMEGGKETGETVAQRILPGGPFADAADRLIGQGFAIDGRALLPPAASGGGDTGDGAAKPERSGRRVRYRCPRCGLKAWAKHEAKLICAEHMLPMTAA